MHTVTEYRFALKILPTSEGLFCSYIMMHCCSYQWKVRTYKLFSEVTANGFELLLCKLMKVFAVAFFFFRDWYCPSTTLQHFPSNRQQLNINHKNMVLLGLTVQCQLHNVTATALCRDPTWQLWLLLLVISSIFSTSLALVRYFPAVCSLVSPICHSPPGRRRRQTQKECLRLMYDSKAPSSHTEFPELLHPSTQ